MAKPETVVRAMDPLYRDHAKMENQDLALDKYMLCLLPTNGGDVMKRKLVIHLGMGSNAKIMVQSRIILTLLGLILCCKSQAQEFNMRSEGDQVSIFKGEVPYLNCTELHFPPTSVEYRGKLGSFKVVEHQLHEGSGRDAHASWDIRSNDSALVLVITAIDLKVSVTELSFPVPKETRFFGGGEQFSHVELTRRKVPFLVEENGIGRGDHPATGIANLVGAGGHEFSSYLPIPLIIGTDNTAYLIENDCFSEADLSVQGRVSFKVHDRQLKLRVWKADSPKQLIAKVTAHLGRMPELPEWTYGTILGIQGGADVVRQRVKDAKTYGNPVTAIWIQDWVGKKKTSIGSRLHWEWRSDSITYPDFPKFCQEMEAQGVRVLGYINPFLLEGTAMTDEAVEKRLIVHRKDGSPYLIPFGGFKGFMLDLTNPAARLWIKDIIKKNMIANGLSGWMADFAEWLPLVLSH